MILSCLLYNMSVRLSDVKASYITCKNINQGYQDSPDVTNLCKVSFP